tara:strand:- start:299 stop:496 length:198 start_codon:yes stop_codon:yes gene_type:complete
MTQQSPQITDQDLQMLLAQNPLAAEQLRRIMAERQVVELQAQLAASNGSEGNVEALAAAEAVDGG